MISPTGAASVPSLLDHYQAELPPMTHLQRLALIQRIADWYYDQHEPHLPTLEQIHQLIGQLNLPAGRAHHHRRWNA